MTILPAHQKRKRFERRGESLLDAAMTLLVLLLVMGLAMVNHKVLLYSGMSKGLLTVIASVFVAFAICIGGIWLLSLFYKPK